MSAYKHMAEMWRNPDEVFIKDFIRPSVIKWRRGPSIIKIDKPTRLDKARILGYKAKQCFTIARVKVRKGGARKSRPRSGRRQKAMGVKKYTRRKSLKTIAEDRARKRFVNLRVLNSYWLWEDGKDAWFEVVMLDPHLPSVVDSKKL